MDSIKQELEQIWDKEYINNLPALIKERGFNYSVNELQKDILITGINPSFRNGADAGNCCFDYRIISNDTSHEKYWTSLNTLVHDVENGIDLRSQTAYLDIFYFRETLQTFLKKEILKKPEGIIFLVDQLRLTQSTIENIIRPRLIIVKNKESAAYWGKLSDKGIFWMGYKLELVKQYDSGELYKIIGLIDSEERVFPELKTTNLHNSLIFFTQHFQYASKAKRPSTKLIEQLLNLQKDLS